jgi:pimeloyl-ACP methyl ester carboxylesterase
MSAFILVHGAWHDGSLLEETAAPIRAAGHDVFLPTLSGNGKNDPKHVGLEDAIQSLTDFITEQNINDAILVAHSYGGMVITGVADRLPERFRRLVYWNAFVPNNGECLNDLVPQFYIDLFDQIVQDDGSVMLPFPVWREAFINDASLELATETYKKLNSQPYQTFTVQTRRCRIACPGIRGSLKSWVCSVWYNLQAAMSSVFRIRLFWPVKSLKPHVIDESKNRDKQFFHYCDNKYGFNRSSRRPGRTGYA